MTTITIHLHNGEQLLLVGVPMDAHEFGVWTEETPVSTWFGYSATDIKYPVKFCLAKNKISVNKILGTWIPRTESIDFSVNREWVENISLGGFGRSYEEWKNYTGQAILTSPEQSFLSLLKSHTKDSGAEKFLILKIEKLKSSKTITT